MLQADLKRLDQVNIQYKEQAITILELTNNFKKICANQNYEGKDKILSIIVDKLYLHNEGSHAQYKDPFYRILTMNKILNEKSVVKNRNWGE